MGRAEDLFEKVKGKGESAIDEFILTRKSEELFLDFKRSEDEGSGRVLHENDRKNLAKAISGFGNSEGGVIVWGVDCTKDKYDAADIPRTKHPIKDVKKFVSLLESAISACTIPPHSKVQNYPLAVNENDDGFVITYIPKSVHAPHQVVKDFKYYMRAGSSFMPVTHGILAGMFGRRPQPHVFHKYFYRAVKVVASDPYKTLPEGENYVHTAFEFYISNDGPGVASDLFMNWLASGIGKDCRLIFEEINDELWQTNFVGGIKVNAMSRPNVRLAPGAELLVFVLTLWLRPPFQDFRGEGICGCGQSESYRFKIRASAVGLENMYRELVFGLATGTMTESREKKLIFMTFEMTYDKEGM